jgi:hypothetical protein
MVTDASLEPIEKSASVGGGKRKFDAGVGSTWTDEQPVLASVGAAAVSVGSEDAMVSGAGEAVACASALQAVTRKANRKTQTVFPQRGHCICMKKFLEKYPL